MSSLLEILALGLAASVTIGGLAWIAGLAMERTTSDPAFRERAWTALFLLPAAALLLVMTAPTAPAAWLQGSGAPVAPQISAPVTVLVQTTGRVLDQRPAANPLPAALVGSALAGALLRLASSIRGARRLRRWVREAQSLDRADVESALAPLAAGLGQAPLLVSDEIDRPLLAGVRRSAVLLPRVLVDRCSPTEIAMTCAHELAHHARRDNLRLILESPLEGLFWFNPFVRACRARLWAAREEVCDAMVLAGASPPTRRVYAGTLVQALRLSAGPGPQTAFTGARRNNTMRLKAILRPARSAGAASKLALLLLGGGLLAPTLVLAAGAVAASAPRNSVHTFTSKTDSAPEVAVIVRADEHEERPDGRSISRGRVEVEARNVPAGMIRVDGKPQPAGFDPSALRGRVERVEVTGTGDDAPPMYDVITRPAPPAGRPSAAGAAPTPAPAEERPAPDFFAGMKPGEIRVAARTVDDTPGDPRTVLYSGDVEIGGTVPGGSELTVLLDGRRLPEGFDVRSVERVEQVRLTMRLADGGRLTARTPPGAPVLSTLEITSGR